MLWLTYRQHRFELGALVLAALALAVGVIASAAIALALKAELGLDQCTGNPFGDPVCALKSSDYISRTGVLGWPSVVLYFFPVVVAAFLGGPLLSREFENGTHRLAWTQSITKTRWVCTKLGVTLAVAAVAGILLASVGGLTQARNLGGSNPYISYDLVGIVPVAYCVFAVACGALLSAALGRSVAAMLGGLLGFAAIRVLIGFVMRERFLAPLDSGLRMPPADAWDLGVRYFNAAGAQLDQRTVVTLIQQIDGAVARQPGFNTTTYLAANDVFQKRLYHPLESYWLLQGIESAIYLGLTVVCVLVAIWLVRRRPI